MTESTAMRLKKLRESAIPKLSTRKMAEALGVGHSRYTYFEDPKRFKKSVLPLDFVRKVAAVFAEHGIDPAEVLKLAGLNDAEAEPEAQKIEAFKSPVRYVMAPMALPSEAALTAMFDALLASVPEGATRFEVASILARRLPVGFAGIGPYLPDQTSGPVEDAGEAPQFPDPALRPGAQR